MNFQPSITDWYDEFKIVELIGLHTLNRQHPNYHCYFELIVCVLRHISMITAMVPTGPRQAMG